MPARKVIEVADDFEIPDNDVDAVAYRVLRPFDVGQLSSELGGWNLSGYGSTRASSYADPAVLVVRGDHDEAELARVLRRHIPEPPGASEFMELVRKADTEEPLTDDELQRAVKMLLRRARR